MLSFTSTLQTSKNVADTPFKIINHYFTSRHFIVIIIDGYNGWDILNGIIMLNFNALVLS